MLSGGRISMLYSTHCNGIMDLILYGVEDLEPVCPPQISFWRVAVKLYSAVLQTRSWPRKLHGTRHHGSLPRIAESKTQFAIASKVGSSCRATPFPPSASWPGSIRLA